MSQTTPHTDQPDPNAPLSPEEALAAEAAPRESVGASLAVMNAVGFGLTLPAIWLTSGLWESLGVWVLVVLVPGPVLGLWSLGRVGLAPTGPGAQA